jgi:hypothetical protein
MSIVFYFDAQGGFTVGDTETRVTAYAYPTSPHATNAKKHATQVAAEMVDGQNRSWRGFDHLVAASDDYNWTRLAKALA